MKRIPIKKLCEWTPTEDAILKGEVAKCQIRDQNGIVTGINWGRVSSVFPEKTGRQCRARMFEFQEWTREEDEYLLLCSRSYPTGWRIKATQALGRSIGQCLSRYLKLIESTPAQREALYAPKLPAPKQKSTSKDSAALIFASQDPKRFLDFLLDELHEKGTLKDMAKKYAASLGKNTI